MVSGLGLFGKCAKAVRKAEFAHGVARPGARGDGRAADPPEPGAPLEMGLKPVPYVARWTGA